MNKSMMMLSYVVLMTSASYAADTFEDMLEKEDKNLAAIFKQEKASFESATDNETKDSIALKLFTGITDWLNGLSIATEFKILEAQKLGVDVNPIMMSFKLINDVVNQELTKWWKLRHNYNLNEQAEAYKGARNEWMDVCCIDWVIQGWCLKLKDIVSSTPDGDTEVSVGTLAKLYIPSIKGAWFEKVTTSGLSHNKLSRLRDEYSLRFHNLWWGNEISEAKNGHYKLLLKAGKFADADEYLQGRFLMKAVDLQRTIKGEKIVYLKGTESEKTPTITELEQKLSQKYSQHISGTSKDENLSKDKYFNRLCDLARSIAGFEMELKKMLDEIAPVIKELNELSWKMFNKAIIDQCRGQLLTFQGKLAIFQSQSDSIVNQKTHAKEAFNRLWFLSANDRAVQKYIPKAPKPSKYTDDDKSGFAKTALSNLVNVEADSNITELDKLVKEMTHKAVAFTWWNQRSQMNSFVLNSNNQNDHEEIRLRAWENKNQFEKFFRAVLSNNPASSMIIWDRPWGDSEMLFERMFWSAKENNYIVANNAWNLHFGHDTGEGFSYGQSADYLKESGTLYFDELYKECQRQGFPHQIINKRIWDETGPLPSVLSASPTVENNRNPWDGATESIVGFYNALNVACGPAVEAKWEELATMFEYQGRTKNADSGALHPIIANAYYCWNKVSVEVEPEGKIDQHRSKIKQYTAFETWVRATIKAISLYGNDPKAVIDANSFLNYFTLNKALPVNGDQSKSIEAARKLWNERGSNSNKNN